MDPTTLVTFFLDSPPSTYSVELLGSWDNFSRPYRLAKDSQVGRGRWHGCHRFQNIVCDGDPSQHPSSRDGPLLCGGTYWYFYLLNGHVEQHDLSKPHTSFCPLLPGQTVNVLEIPLLVEDPTDAGSDGSLPHPKMTLDPDDRKVNPKPDQSRPIRLLDRLPSRLWYDKHRQEYFEKSLGRLQTAAADILTWTHFGYRKPRNPLGAMKRPASAAARPPAHYVSQKIVENDGGCTGPCKSAKMTSDNVSGKRVTSRADSYRESNLSKPQTADGSSPHPLLQRNILQARPHSVPVNVTGSAKKSCVTRTTAEAWKHSSQAMRNIERSLRGTDPHECCKSHQTEKSLHELRLSIACAGFGIVNTFPLCGGTEFNHTACHTSDALQTAQVDRDNAIATEISSSSSWPEQDSPVQNIHSPPRSILWTPETMSTSECGTSWSSTYYNSVGHSPTTTHIKSATGSVGGTGLNFDDTIWAVQERLKATEHRHVLGEIPGKPTSSIRLWDPFPTGAIPQVT